MAGEGHGFVETARQILGPSGASQEHCEPGWLAAAVNVERVDVLCVRADHR